MNRRPPLAVSPRRLRPRPTQPQPPLPQPKLAPRQLSAPSIGTPLSARKSTKPSTEIPARSSVSVEFPSQLPEYQLISSELMALAKRAKEEFGIGDDSVVIPIFAPKSPLFERGRFYEVYSARRNERLKRKKVEVSEEETVAQDPGVAVELAKRKNSKKAAAAAAAAAATDGMLKSASAADLSASRLSTLRSAVRSGKEMKKPAAAAASESSAVTGRRTSTRHVRKL